MSRLTVDLTDLESITLALSILTQLSTNGCVSCETATDPDLIGGEDNHGDDGLGDLFGGEVSTEPTIDNVKDAITDLAKAKGRDVAKALITKALAKLKVAKLEEVPTEKFTVLIDVLKKATA